MKKKRMIVGTLALSMMMSMSLVEGVHATSKVDELMSKMTLNQKIGQMLMPDFRKWAVDGATKESDFTVMNDEVREIIDRYDFGGVILFAENVKGTEQTLKLTNDLQDAAVNNKEDNVDIPLLLTIDQEGGIVYRLGSGSALPGNMAIGATNDPQSAREVGEVIGRELNALGINVNFAPVFDTNNNPNNPVIGLRSFSSDPHIVANLGVPMMKGMQKYNTATAAKHFPGRGDTATDSHTGLPLVNKSHDELSRLELIPYKAVIANGVDMLMTAHIQYPQIEKDQVVSKKDNSKIYVPATLSDDIIKGIVRDEMKYDGVVVTDAMNMNAIAEHFGEAEAAIMAIKADVDIVLMPTILRSKSDLTKINHIIAEIKKAIEKGDIDRQSIDQSVKRILTLKEKRGILDYTKDTRTWEEKLQYAKNQVGSNQNRDIERRVSAQAVTVVKDDKQILPLKPSANEKVLLLGAYNNELPGMELGMRRLIDEKVLSDKVQYESVRYSKTTQIDDLKQHIDSSDYIVVISEVGNAGQMSSSSSVTRVPSEVCEYAKSVNKKVVVMSISKPYDVVNYDSDVVIAVYGNKGMDPTEGLRPSNAFGPNITAGIEVIFGGHDAQGQLPVDIYEFKDGSYTDKVVYPLGHGIKYRINVDKSNLQAYYDEVVNVKNNGYTKDSWNHFSNKLAEAKNILGDRNASSNQVNKALDALKSAYVGLEKVVVIDKSTLQDMIAKGDKLHKEGYTKESWDAFEKVLKEAKAILNTDKVTQKEVDDVKDRLVKAMNELNEVTVLTKPERPTDTSDMTMIAPWIGIVGISLVGIFFGLKRRKD